MYLSLLDGGKKLWNSLRNIHLSVTCLYQYSSTFSVSYIMMCGKRVYRDACIHVFSIMCVPIGSSHIIVYSTPVCHGVRQIRSIYPYLKLPQRTFKLY